TLLAKTNSARTPALDACGRREHVLVMFSSEFSKSSSRMSGKRIDQAGNFVSSSARLLERRLFAFHFERGDAVGVIEALSAYRNPDGGSGWGLEPDKRDPASQPQDAQFALEVMDAVGALDCLLVPDLCDWLVTVTTDEGGVPFALPSLNDHPHAPWWSV